MNTKMSPGSLLWIEGGYGSQAKAVDGEMDLLFLVEDEQLLLFDVVVRSLQDRRQRHQAHDLRARDGQVQVLGVLLGLRQENILTSTSLRRIAIVLLTTTATAIHLSHYN